MQELQRLRRRLHQEEALQARTARQIRAVEEALESARQRVELATRRLTELRRQADVSAARINRLTTHIELLERRQPATDSEGEPGLRGSVTAAERPGPPAGAAGPRSEAGTEGQPTPISFDVLDPQRLAAEVLPRAGAFEEELLLLMAFYRKAMRPRDIVRTFRNLDYTPMLTPTEATIKTQLEADPRLFEHAGEGRFALTPEGRAEALGSLRRLAG